MRLQRSLAGSWQFQVDPEGNAHVETLAPDRQIPVPLPWQAAFPDLQQYSGYAWYRTSVNLEQSWLDGELLLEFGAVDYWCQVFVNGQLVGEHEGGYTAFSFPIRSYARQGENEIAVRVYDTVQTGINVPRWPQNSLPENQPFDARNIPHGKQEWYINVGGIWQDVTLTAVPAAYIEWVHVTPTLQGRADIRVRLAGAVVNGTLGVEIGTEATSVPVTEGQQDYTLSVEVKNPKLWGLEAPNLYTATLNLEAGRSRD